MSDIESKDMGNTPDSVPYIVHEAALARHERYMKRLWILCIIIFAALIGTNMAWIVYENQFQDEVITSTQEITQDSGEGGTNTFTGDFIGGGMTDGKADDTEDNDNDSPNP